MNHLTAFWSPFLAIGSAAVVVQAQTVIPLVSFDVSGTNGAYPEAAMTLGPDGNFYGTTESGGASGHGAIFKVTPTGSLTTLVSFNSFNGANPLDALLSGPDGDFYGTTEYGGNTIGISSLNAGNGGGTVFRVTTNGSLTTLVNFAGTNGASPHAGLAWGLDGNLYGTTASGGLGADGTVFRVTTNGTLTTLTNFLGTANGANPFAGLTLGPDGNFYGTTQGGGASNSGTVFEVTTNGTLKTLYAFGVTNGISPETSLALGPDGNFYGTTMQSYYVPYTIFPGFTINLPSGNGTVFQVTSNGVWTLVADLDNYNAGTYPNANLMLGPDGDFYGVTDSGGGYGYGALFRVTTNGMLTVPVNFDNTNGAYAIGGLTVGPDENIYGTTTAGGAGANGNVFRFSPFSVALAANAGGFTVSATSYPNSTNRIWAATNLALPSSWQVLGTIIMDTNGVGQLPDPNVAGDPAKYYRLSYP